MHFITLFSVQVISHFLNTCIYVCIHITLSLSLSLPLFISLGEKEFWSNQWGTAESKRDQIFWHNRQKMARFLNTEVQLTVDEGLEQALIEGREVLFTSDIADSYVFSSPDMALTILIKESVEKKVGSNKVFTYISRFHYLFFSQSNMILTLTLYLGCCILPGCAFSSRVKVTGFTRCQTS
jgi:hypothetical protein